MENLGHARMASEIEIVSFMYIIVDKVMNVVSFFRRQEKENAK